MLARGESFAYDCIPEISDEFSGAYRETLAINEATGENHAYVELDYAQYLQTEEWREYRQAVLDRQENGCATCERDATHCHHRTYRHIGWEADADCVGLCVDCHGKQHKKRTRQRRK
jgi:hypothetical protein